MRRRKNNLCLAYTLGSKGIHPIHPIRSDPAKVQAAISCAPGRVALASGVEE